MNLMEFYEKSGIKIARNSEVIELDYIDEKVQYKTINGEINGGFDEFIWAIGREPQTSKLNL